MKSLVVLFFGMLFWTHASLARHADVSFFTKWGEPFQVVLDGRLMNRYATDQLHLAAIPAGFHVAEIRLPDRFGALVHRTRIYVEPGFKVDYLIQVVGRRPKVVISKVRQYPLPVARPLPRPYRPRPDRYHDRYDKDHRDKDHRDKDRYGDRYHDRYEDDNKSRQDDRENHRDDGRYNDRYEEESDNRYDDRDDGRNDEPADNRRREQYRQQRLTAAKQKPPLVQ